MTKENMPEWQSKVINIIAKLDNGSHSSNQLQGVDEALTKLIAQERAKAVSEVVDYIERSCPQIAALDTTNGKLRIEISEMPEGKYFLILTDKVIKEALSRGESKNTDL